MELNAAVWQKSSRSGSSGGQCVEVAGLVGRVAVRDGKVAGGPIVVVNPEEWRVFLAGIKSR
ncbi:DUF397 domain-containing protein [Sphaerisporangium sp. NPDC005289]|uniref:DUF397 domain-containing protein n=1 Tax=Sphaerisporangium sp. NPDC005289 TaxID=3155247 RepID=UPI0033AA894A